MKASEKNKVLMFNAVLWFLAMVLHPLSRLMPTGSGQPPKIFEVLIPLFFILLAGISTYLMNAVVGRPKDG